MFVSSRFTGLSPHITLTGAIEAKPNWLRWANKNMPTLKIKENFRLQLSLLRIAVDQMAFHHPVPSLVQTTFCL